MIGEPSDQEFTRRALRLLPPVQSAPGFEKTLLAGFEAWQGRRGSSLKRVLDGFCDLVWPGAPRWALAGAFAVSLLAGVTLGAVLPAPDQDRMAFSLEQTPAFSLSSDKDEDL